MSKTGPSRVWRTCPRPHTSRSSVQDSAQAVWPKPWLLSSFYNQDSQPRAPSFWGSCCPRQSLGCSGALPPDLAYHWAPSSVYSRQEPKPALGPFGQIRDVFIHLTYTLLSTYYMPGTVPRSIQQWTKQIRISVLMNVHDCGGHRSETNEYMK